MSLSSMHPNVASKPINKNATQNAMTSPYDSKVRHTQNTGVPLSPCLDYGAFGKGKVFSENSNLSNLVNIQR